MSRALASLVTAALALLVLLGAPAVAPAPAFAASPSAEEDDLLGRVNGERRRRGLQELRWSGELAAIARAHAEDMRQAARLSHTSRDGSTYEDRLQQADIAVQSAAENVALDISIAGAHTGLMNSPGHRRNILDPELEEIGIGLAWQGGALWVVEDFATPVARLTPEEAHLLARSTLERAAVARGDTRLEEEPVLSRRMRDGLTQMIERDDVSTIHLRSEGPVWLYAFTTPAPDEFPGRVRRQASRAARFGLAVAFARTPSAPHGTYWVAVALKPAEEKR